MTCDAYRPAFGLDEIFRRARTAKSVSASVQPERIDQRYRVQRRLGRGGMASVYEVFDPSLDRLVALKRLLRWAIRRRRARRSCCSSASTTRWRSSRIRASSRSTTTASTTAGPYYTMELLDGGDLRERAPLPWREACALLRDVCSSLALLHSRRLVHRDVSPRNVRCTRDGRAKLIDFGAMAPMGASAPGRRHAAVRRARGAAPRDARRAHRSVLARRDAVLRADRPHAVSGARLRELLDAVAHAPRAAVAARAGRAAGARRAGACRCSASTRRAAAQRGRGDGAPAPRSPASSATSRLSVSQAYLSTPTLVGRDGARSALRGADRAHALARPRRQHADRGRRRRRPLAHARRVRARGQAAGRVRAARRRGRRAAGPARDARRRWPSSWSRPIRWPRARPQRRRACAACCSRTRRSAQKRGGPISATVPPRARNCRTRSTRWILRVANEKPIVIAVDDVQRIDEASARAARAPGRQGARAQTAARAHAETTDAQVESPAMSGSAAAARQPSNCGRCTAPRKPSCSARCSATFPTSTFVCNWVHEIARGNPRLCMEPGAAPGRQGNRQLSRRQLDAADEGAAIQLPGTVEEVWQQRIARLSPLARMLGRGPRARTRRRDGARAVPGAGAARARGKATSNSRCAN